MSYASEHPVDCSEPSCDASVKGSKFALIKAHEEGWFFQRTGEAWCPSHNPEWVTAWREGQER